MIAAVVNDLLTNKTLIAVLMAWVGSQIIKTVILSIKNRQLTLSRMFKSGSMPSSHSATVSALSTSIGITEGFSSSFFIICLCFGFLVLLDSVNVRGTVDKNTKALNMLLKKEQKKQIKEHEGHTWPQVLAGVLLGMSTALLVYSL